MAERRIDPGLLLLLTPILWGATFPAAKLGIVVTGIYPFMAWTRVIGFLTIVAAIPLVARRQIRGADVRRVVGPGLLLGSFIFLGYTLQTEGLARTTATNAGFITGLYVVFVPILGVLLFRQSARRAVWIAVVLSVVGLALLSVPSLRDLRPRFGDLLVLAGSVAWAAHVVTLGRFVGRHLPVLLSAAQMGGAAALHVVATLALGEGLRPEGAVDAWHLLLVTGVLGSGVAYTLQVLAQRQVTAARAVVILAGESVSAAAFSAVWLGERLAFHQWIGALLVLGAMAVSELSARRADLRAEAATPV
ncbi:MAG: DMT family transporter [Actinomycetota bacterium]